MVRSAPDDSVGRIGTGFISAPSTRIWLSVITGVSNEGMATEARMASASEPSWNHTSRWDSRSVATAV